MPKFVPVEEAQAACTDKALPGSTKPAPAALTAPLPSRPNQAAATAVEAPKVPDSQCMLLLSVTLVNFSRGIPNLLGCCVPCQVCSLAVADLALLLTAAQQHTGDARMLLTERRSASQKEKVAQVQQHRLCSFSVWIFASLCPIMSALRYHSYPLT
jgi:hypothetical protein